MTWPPEPNTWQFELMKAAFSAVVAIVGLILTWIIGQRLASRWAVWQKQREIELQTATRFYELYGEFVTVWRLWKVARNDLAEPGRAAAKWKLLERASAAEGSLEAICIKIASERSLAPDEARAVSVFRKLYQELRQRIRRDLPLDWDYEKTAYIEFKRHAGIVATLLQRASGDVPDPIQAARSLDGITAVRRAEVLLLIGENDRGEQLSPIPEDSGRAVPAKSPGHRQEAQ